MIDPTRPIRRKSDGMRVFIVSEERYYRLQTASGPVFKEWPSELERDYENIPEPRKPQGWWLSTRSRCAVPDDGHTPIGFEPDDLRYLIEWTKGAPLPDYPEE